MTFCELGKWIESRLGPGATPAMATDPGGMYDDLFYRKPLPCHPCLLSKIENPNIQTGLVLGGKVIGGLYPTLEPGPKASNDNVICLTHLV